MLAFHWHVTATRSAQRHAPARCQASLDTWPATWQIDTCRAEQRPVGKRDTMLEPKTIARYERELRAMLRTAGDEDPEGFAQVHQLLLSAVNALPVAAELNRRQHGYSWADLARPLGISRQAAQQRLSTSTGGDVEAIKARLRDKVTLYDRPICTTTTTGDVL